MSRANINRLLHKKINKAWEDFQITGEVKEVSAVKEEIVASWNRCRKNSLDPYDNPNKIVVSEEELERRRLKSRVLLLNTPMILNIFVNIIGGLGFRFDLYDSDLILLTQFGNKEIMEEARKNGIVPGLSREEGVSGTAAPNLAKMYKKPFHILGPEHYNKNLHHLTCASTPIYIMCEFIGVLSISGHYSLLHGHTLGLVIALGRLIEKQITQGMMLKDLRLSEDYLKSVIDSISDGIIVVDDMGTITMINQIAKSMFDVNDDVVGAKVASIFGEENIFEEVLETKCSIRNKEISLVKDNRVLRFISNIDSISNRENFKGIVSVLKPMPSAKSLVKNVYGLRAHFTFNDIIGESDLFHKVVTVSKHAASVGTTILLQGESGTGKEVFAQAIHNESRFGNGPFVALNCAAVPGELIESELFGYERGAFTGASKDGRQGKFELAENGTIFLDEISSMPLSMQATLLRVIQTKKIVRLGGNEEIPVNARLICATNRDLWEQVMERTFREDLFYRINVFMLEIPPLRKRIEDIPLLARFFVRQKGDRYNYNMQISDEVIDFFCRYHWRGNVRELENVVERALVMASARGSKTIEIQDVISYNGFSKTHSYKDGEIVDGEGGTLAEAESSSDQIDDSYNLQEKEIEFLKKAIKSTHGNITQAAKLMGISRATLHRKLKLYGIKCSKMIQ